MGFGAISQPSTGGPTDLDPWSSRPLTGNSDGDLGVGPSGSTYRWSSVIGEWVQAWIYDLGGTFVLRGKIDGDADPASESPAWTESIPVGGGSISNDGTYVEIDTSSAVGDKAYCDLSHGVSGGSYLLCGNLTVTDRVQSGSGSKLRFTIHTGSYRANIDYAGVNFSNNAVLTNSSAPPAEVGNRLSATTLSTEKWVELYVIAGTTPTTSKGAVFSYVDHVLRGISDLDEFTTSTSTIYRIGDADSLAGALLKIRQLKAGTWS